MSCGPGPLAYEAKSHRLGGGFFIVLTHAVVVASAGAQIAWEALWQVVAQLLRIAPRRCKTLRGNPETALALATISSVSVV